MIIGIDEAGRGAWAGPLTAAAVLLFENVGGLQDSKLLSKQQRHKLLPQIQSAGYVGVGWASSEEIDELGLTAAQTLCMQRAIRYLPKDCPILIDGNINYLKDIPSATCQIDADASEPTVMAASVVAKSLRDSFMQAIDVLYPAYGFGQHVGYGTAFHRQQILINGPCFIHRRSFKPLSRMRQSA